MTERLNSNHHLRGGIVIDNSVFTFLRNGHTVFHRGCAVLLILSYKPCTRFSSSTSSPALVIFNFVDFTPPGV